MAGCNTYKSDEFSVSGEITSIDGNKGYVYLDHSTKIKYEDFKQLKVGQTVKFILYSISKDDGWIYDKIKVKTVEILENP